MPARNARDLPHVGPNTRYSLAQPFLADTAMALEDHGAQFRFVQAKANCPNLWVTSKAENGVCVSHTTYSDALAICEGFGARFCTVEENFSDCTRPAKCGLNDRKVWAALSPGTSPI